MTAAALNSRLRQKLTQAVRADRKIRQPHLELERTDLPANVGCCDLGKDDMKECGPDARYANGQEQDPPKQPISDGRAGSAQPRKHQRGHEQKHRQVAKDEGDRFGHHGLLMRTRAGLDRGRTAR